MHKKIRMTRGNIAKQLNVNPETLRYYETQKLIKKPNRLENNYRVYDEEDMLRIKFILMAKQLGFSLKEIKNLLNISLTEKSDRAKVRILASNKSNLIKEKIMQLTRMKNALDELILLCKNNSLDAYCPILKALYEK